ncbi:MAG: hypothetical protein COA94_09210 [Rickettsiales bacterium]|nr:MAG: hypothetical protein COA94_09210 [Rickettsiales bacterium]
MLQNIYNLSGGINSQYIFTITLAAIVIGWILVSLWTRVLENVAFGSFGYDSKSSLDSMIVSLAVTVIFVAFVWMVDEYGVVGVESEVISSDRLKSTVDNLSKVHTDHMSKNENGNPIIIFPH